MLRVIEICCNVLNRGSSSLYGFWIDGLLICEDTFTTELFASNYILMVYYPFIAKSTVKAMGQSLLAKSYYYN